MISIRKVQHYLFSILAHPFLFVVYGLSHLSPRRNNLWVFGIRNTFTWSSKYLFLYTAQQQKDEVKALWISRNRSLVQELREKGLPAAYWLSWKALWHCLKAKVYIYDASVETINYWLSGGAIRILLWHGSLPFKKIERDVQTGEALRAKLFVARGFLAMFFRFLLPWRFLSPDYAAASSKKCQEIFSSALQISPERIWLTGFPKNDLYFRDIPASEVGTDTKILERMKTEHRHGKKVVLYAPTWRDTKGEFALDDAQVLRSLDRFLEEHRLEFFLKLHPLTGVSAVRKTEHIHVIDAQSDADPLLKEADILITDYSGIFFEFLLLDRPIIFFPYDYEKYVTKDRELYFDYEEITPGPKARTFEELLSALKDISKGKDAHASFRARVREMCYARQDGQSSERVFYAIKKII